MLLDIYLTVKNLLPTVWWEKARSVMDKCYSFSDHGDVIGYISEDGYGNVVMKTDDIFTSQFVFAKSHNMLGDLVGSIDPKNNLHPKSAILETEDGKYTIIFDNGCSDVCNITVHHNVSNFNFYYVFSSINDVTGEVEI